MRAVALIALTGLTLSACGERAEKAEPTWEQAASGVSALPDARVDVPVELTADQLRRVCQAGLAAIHGQMTADIKIDGLEGQIVNASWRAPVDGGRRRAQCRIDGDRVIWKPQDRLTADANRWMDQSGDPVTRFVLDGETVTINQTPSVDGSATGADPVAGE